MNPQSLWHKTVDIATRKSLAGDMCTDVVVIGAGMAGLLTAYLLTQSGMKVVVLEASRIASGQTGNTTAKITAQHGILYSSLIQSFGHEKAQQYATANIQAIEKYRELITHNKIACDSKELSAYLYSAVDAEPMMCETKAAQSLGIAASFINNLNTPFPIKGAVCFAKQAQFHPLLFIAAIADELTIYENTCALSVHHNTVLTNHGSVHAQHIVFATHYPFLNVPGWYFLRIYQERSYVLALENTWLPQGTFLGTDADGLSFREANGMLLMGGGDHRTGENTAGEKYELLRKRARELFPDSREFAHWSAQDCITADQMPYIGHYAEATPHWYVATGFAKWGMTGSMVSAILLSGMILGQPPAWASLFSPQRSTFHASAKDMAIQTMQAFKGLARGVLVPPKAMLDELPNEHGGIVVVDGCKVGVYKNKLGECTLVDPHCPHMHCQVEWNPDERSWDCPCHGSRFHFDGTLIDNPAQENLHAGD